MVSSNSSKKWTNEFVHSTVRQKKIVRLFFGGIVGLKKPFWICLTFRNGVVATQCVELFSERVIFHLCIHILQVVLNNINSNNISWKRYKNTPSERIIQYWGRNKGVSDLKVWIILQLQKEVTKILIFLPIRLKWHTAEKNQKSSDLLKNFCIAMTSQFWWLCCVGGKIKIQNFSLEAQSNSYKFLNQRHLYQFWIMLHHQTMRTLHWESWLKFFTQEKKTTKNICKEM